MTSHIATSNKTSLTVIKGAQKSPQNLKWVDFWRQYEPFIYKACRAKLRRPEDVEDAMSMVKVQLFTAIKNYDPNDGSFRVWLKTVAIRRAIDLARKVIKEGERQGELLPKTTKAILIQGERKGDPLSDLSHFSATEISTSGGIGKHINDGVHIFGKERGFRGVV